jgi:fatty-acyl-CoA synthase
VCAAVQLHVGRQADPIEIVAFVKAKIGSVKAPKQVDVWPDLPRSKIGKVLKREIRAQLLRK